MKAIRLLLLFLFALPLTLEAQNPWFRQNPASTEYILYSVSVLDADHIVTVGTGGLVLYSTNAGNSWIEAESGSLATLRSVTFYDASLCIALGDAGVMLKSTDKGVTWAEIDNPADRPLYDMYFTDADNWLIVGNKGTFMRTTDGGQTFDKAASGTNNINGIDFHDSFGVMVGNDGILRVSNDSGRTWKGEKSGTDIELWSVSVGDDSTAVVAGGNGIILRSDNYGKDWVMKAASVPISQYRLTDVQHLTRDKAIMVSWGGLILHTEDSGNTWVPQASGVALSLESVSFADEQHGNAVGWNGLIVRTNSGGVVVDVKQLADAPLPAETAIESVWPNPFAHSRHAEASLRFSVPVSGNVDLRVYNLIGVEVTRVRSNQMDAGSYVISWDATHLHPGVYFYRLSTQSGTATKRFSILR